MESQLELIQNSVNNHYSNWVYEALNELPENFVITDPTISGHPIVFASQGCLEMFGYCKEEVLGRNGRMFQGQGTCRRTIMEIREAIREERPIQVNLLNYRKDGTPFWVLFHMSPVFSEEDGRAIHFVAVQVPILRNSVNSSRSRFCFCDDHGVRLRDSVVGSCRREVCLDSVLKLSRGSGLDLAIESGKGIEVEELFEASELEKQKAMTCINNILSVLIRYSAFRGKSVSECCVKGGTLPNSALLTSLGRIKQSFVLFDPFLPGVPIVYASDAFFKLTGYTRHEVLGCSHRFLSGSSNTDESTLLQIKECIQNSKPCKVRIRDYRKDMTSFWNLLHISPIRNASGKVAYFVEVHMEEHDSISKEGEAPNLELKQLGCIAAVKVAVRSATMGPASSKQ